MSDLQPPAGRLQPISEGDPLPDVPVVTIHGKAVSLREAQGPGSPLVLLPFRGPW